MKIDNIQVTFHEEPGPKSEVTSGGYTVTPADDLFKCRILVQVETLNKIKSVGREIKIVPGRSIEELIDDLNVAFKEIVSEINNESSRD